MGAAAAAAGGGQLREDLGGERGAEEGRPRTSTSRRVEAVKTWPERTDGGEFEALGSDPALLLGEPNASE